MAWLFKQPESKLWWIGYRINGKQHRYSTGETDEEKAKQALAKVDGMFSAAKGGYLEALYQQLGGQVTVSRTLKSALKDWLSDSKLHTSEGTCTRYREVAASFEEFCAADEKAPLLSLVSVEMVRQYVNDRMKVVSPLTARVEKKILATFFSFCQRNEWTTKNPAALVKVSAAREKALGRVRRPFTLEELRLMFSKAPNDFWRYMLVAGFYTGQRLGDLVELPWERVDFQNGMIHFIQKKTGVTVHAPMSRQLREVLLSLKKRTGKKEPVGPIWPEEAERYGKDRSKVFSNEFYALILTPCGLVDIRKDKKGHKKGRDVRRQINSVSFHCLRHSFVSMLKLTGASQTVAKELAGHSSDQISDVYTHTPPETLQSAVDALPSIQS